MSGKGSISRMSDECLMKQETVFSFYIVYQAVMRKFTLAGKSLNQMLEFSETYSRLHNLHPIRELDADGDLLADVSHPVSRILKGMPYRIMHLTLLTNLCCFRLNFRLFFSGHSCNCYWIYLLMRLPVPFVESWEVDSVLCAEFLYRDILRKALSLVQKPKAFKIF